MIGLMYLAAICIYIAAVMGGTNKVSSKTKRYILRLALFTLPIGYLNWYPLYPSYSKFIELCNSENRSIIHKVVETESIFIEDLSNRENQIPEVFKKYGYKTVVIPRWFQKYTSFTKISDGTISRKEIDTFPDLNSSTIEKEWIVENTLLMRNIKTVDPKLGLVAEAKNYTYFPYGNTWAKFLGGSSNMAPNKSCQIRFVNNSIFDIYVPSRLNKSSKKDAVNRDSS
jgi:hypothetical protein